MTTAVEYAASGSVGSRNTERRFCGRLLLFAPFALALLLAGASLWMFTQNNDFPLDYHPDEPGKVAQLMHPDQIRNFNHPLLMLETANAVRVGLGVDSDERAIAIAGRWTSAALAAVAVLALRNGRLPLRRVPGAIHLRQYGGALSGVECVCTLFQGGHRPACGRVGRTRGS
jgi:hypothetical protein